MFLAQNSRLEAKAIVLFNFYIEFERDEIKREGRKLFILKTNPRVFSGQKKNSFQLCLYSKLIFRISSWFAFLIT